MYVLESTAGYVHGIMHENDMAVICKENLTVLLSMSI